MGYVTNYAAASWSVTAESFGTEFTGNNSYTFSFNKPTTSGDTDKGRYYLHLYKEDGLQYGSSYDGYSSASTWTSTTWSVTFSIDTTVNSGLSSYRHRFTKLIITDSNSGNAEVLNVSWDTDWHPSTNQTGYSDLLFYYDPANPDGMLSNYSSDEKISWLRDLSGNERTLSIARTTSHVGTYKTTGINHGPSVIGVEFYPGTKGNVGGEWTAESNTHSIYVVAKSNSAGASFLEQNWYSGFNYSQVEEPFRITGTNQVQITIYRDNWQKYIGHSILDITPTNPAIFNVIRSGTKSTLYINGVYVGETEITAGSQMAKTSYCGWYINTDGNTNGSSGITGSGYTNTYGTIAVFNVAHNNNERLQVTEDLWGTSSIATAAYQDRTTPINTAMSTLSPTITNGSGSYNFSIYSFSNKEIYNYYGSNAVLHPLYDANVVWTIPDGLSLNASTGAITGAPTTVGTYKLFIADSNSGNTLFGYTTITVTEAATMSYQDQAIPSQTANPDYNANIAPEITNGSGTYNFTITAGSLPPGLSLNASTGVISGKATTEGIYTFTVTDSA